MNDYRITDKLGEITVTADSEKAARRAFKNFRKCSDAEIITVTLTRENVPDTREQKREALERIRDDDAAYSMKARYEEAQNKLRQEIAEHQATRKELQRAQQALRDAESNVEYLGRKVEEAQGRAIPADLWKAVYDAATAARDRAAATMAEAAEKMVQNADSPDCPAFGAAVREYKFHKRARDEAEKIMGRLEGIAPDGAEIWTERRTNT